MVNLVMVVKKNKQPSGDRRTGGLSDKTCKKKIYKLHFNQQVVTIAPADREQQQQQTAF